MPLKAAPRLRSNGQNHTVSTRRPGSWFRNCPSLAHPGQSRASRTSCDSGSVSPSHGLRPNVQLRPPQGKAGPWDPSGAVGHFGWTAQESTGLL